MNPAKPPPNMSEKINDGGPAFPWQQSPGNQNNLGLTKREHYAGLAMQGLLGRDILTADARPYYEMDSSRDIEKLAAESVEVADALLAELAKEKQ